MYRDLLRFEHWICVVGLSAAFATGCGKGQSEVAAETKGTSSANATPAAGKVSSEGAKSANGAAPSGAGSGGQATTFTDEQLIYECEESAFDSDKSSADVFVAWFHADWCPSCEKQRRELEPLARTAIKGSPVICRYDYDETEDLQGKLRVQRQSSFIRYVNGTEQARSVGETGKERLIKFLEG